MAKFLCPTKLSENISETPEGYLLCKAVPIARTGVMEYGEGETPLKVGDDGIVYVSREAADLFDKRAIASFEGKSLTVKHPETWVGPTNWKELTKGTMHNVRRGVELDEDGEEPLLADVLVTEAFAITLVKNGLREVSCGYEAIYEQTGPGKGKQTNFVGNHLALVEEGRAGQSYAIRDNHRKVDMKDKIKKILAFMAGGKTIDQAMAEVEKGSKTKLEKSKGVSQAVTDAKAIIKKAQKVIDDANGQTAGQRTETNTVMDEENQKSYDAMSAACDALKGAMDAMKPSKDAAAAEEEESEESEDADADKDDDKDKSKDADEDDDDKKKKAKEAKDDDEDSVESRLKALEQALTKLLESAESEDDAEEEESEESEDADLEGGEEKKKKTGDAALAEILCPGFEAPKGAKDNTFRKLALKAALKDATTGAVILALNGGKAPTLDSAERVSTLFIAASEVMKVKNGNGLGGTKEVTNKSITFDSHDSKKSFGMTPDEMNEANAAYYAAKK